MPTTMLAAIAWSINTRDEQSAGTDDKVTCEVLRDNTVVARFEIEPGNTAALDRDAGDVWRYDFKRMHLASPVNPSLSQGVVGVEFPQGIPGHLKMRLRIAGEDRWIKDSVVVYGRVGELYRDEEGGSLLVFNDGDQWIDLGTFSKRKVLSTDPREGSATLTLLF